MAGRRRALIVANDSYENEGLRHLRSPAADAEALSDVLGDPQIGGFEVTVVRNEAAHDIGARIEDLFADSRPDDLLLLHLSCHGLKSESGELYFAAPNTRPNRLVSTAVAAEFVQRCMRSARARSVVLLLDCCYGGAFGQGVAVRAAGDVNVLDSFAGARLGGGRGRAVITASSAMEYAFEGDHLTDDRSSPPSVFTSALVEGLATGEADRDEDGWVSLTELYEYVFDKVRERNPHQTPSRDIEMQGDLLLARSRRRRIRALPLPPELRDALTDPNAYARLGAVAELRSRVVSDDLPTAAGAYEALSDVARTDVRHVAAAAEAALSDMALRIEPEGVDLGRAAAGGPSPSRTVRLHGPALARSCTYEVSDRRVRVEEVPDGLRVSLDTARTGEVEATVSLSGLTGQAVVAVVGEVAGGAPLDRAGADVPAEPDAEEAADVVGPRRGTPLASGTAAPVAASQRVRDPDAGRPTQRVLGVPLPAAVTAMTYAVGLVSLVLGYFVLDQADQSAWDVVGLLLAVQVVAYGALRLVQSADPHGPPVRSVLLMTSGVLAVVLAALTWPSPDDVWPVCLYWLVDGAIGVVTTLLGGAGHRRALELPVSLAAGTIGAVTLVLLVRDWDTNLSRVSVALGFWLLVLGVALLVLGRLGSLERRQAGART
ncbi:MAG TPA: caspase family protein [Jiangellales bacterium]|nr:caspase family protein [Jiangellales bacterium]